MAEQSKQVVLQTYDGGVFKIDQDVAEQFGNLENIMGDGKPLRILSTSLARIIEYCQKYSEFRDYYWCDSRDLKAFQDGFVNGVNNQEFKQLLIAAYYLGVKELLDLLCHEVGNRIRNKSVEYIRKLFGIENDFTPEEEKELREKYAWAFEDLDDD